MSDYHSEIAEWWDRDGEHHLGHPTDEQLLDDAVEIVNHLWDDEGNDVYFTSFSNDGWEPQERDVECDDAWKYYALGV